MNDRMVENHMVVGDYYPEASEVDEAILREQCREEAEQAITEPDYWADIPEGRFIAHAMKEIEAATNGDEIATQAVLTAIWRAYKQALENETQRRMEEI